MTKPLSHFPHRTYLAGNPWNDASEPVSADDVEVGSSETKTMCSDRIPLHPVTSEGQAAERRLLAEWDANVQAYVQDGWVLLTTSEIAHHPSGTYRKLEVLTRPKR